MIHALDIVTPERSKYEQIWSIKEYGDKSPGEENVERFLQICKPRQPRPGATIADYGCGAGVAGLRLEKMGYEVWYVDITDAGLRPEVPRERFYKGPLWSLPRLNVSYGFCCDVMEHIPPEYTLLTIHNMLEGCGLLYLHICNQHDLFGQVIGQPLHLTVQSYSWWLARLASISNVIDARDLCGNSLFVVGRL